jgi:hypothetical protein
MSAVLHSVPLPRYVPPWLMHIASAICMQMTVPVGLFRQHAPVGVGVGQMPGIVQLVPGPRKMPFCAAQLACVACTHVTPAGLLMQQAPVWFVFEHVNSPHCVPSPRYVPPRLVQSASVVTTHVIDPPAAMQHAPPVWARAVVALSSASAANPIHRQHFDT